MKITTKTLDDTLRDLRTAFGTKKPAYKVFRELFVNEHCVTTRTDVFICKVRALITQLPALLARVYEAGHDTQTSTSSHMQ